MNTPDVTVDVKDNEASLLPCMDSDKQQSDIIQPTDSDGCIGMSYEAYSDTGDIENDKDETLVQY